MRILTRVIVLAMLIGMALPALAQSQYTIGVRPNSGDIWVDARLDDLNIYASGNMDGFVDEVVVSYGAPRQLVREYVVQRHWAPADVYYACALAYYSRRTCSSILNMYEREHHRGWGVLAKRIGIAPGSRDFHRLKGQMGKSQEKWHKGRDNRRDRDSHDRNKNHNERDQNRRRDSDRDDGKRKDRSDKQGGGHR